MVYSEESAAGHHGHAHRDGKPEATKELLPHAGGFTEDTIKQTLEKAGLENVQWSVIGKVPFHGKIIELFVAEGTRPASL
jgi:hypothetical protein